MSSNLRDLLDEAIYKCIVTEPALATTIINSEVDPEQAGVWAEILKRALERNGCLPPARNPRVQGTLGKIDGTYGIKPLLKGELGTIDGGYTIIIHPSQALDLAKPFDPNELDDDEEVEAQPKPERMRDWKQK